MEMRIIPIYPAYSVSECGTVVLSHKTNKPIALSIQRLKGRETGYVYASLLWEGYNENTERWEYLRGGHRRAVHRLVAEAFHGPPPEGKPWVNHKDGNKGNNHYMNLEWMSISENIQHAHDTGLIVRPKGEAHWRYGTTITKATKAKMSAKKIGENHPKFKGWYVINGRKYASSIEAARELGTYPKAISRMCFNRVDGCYFLDKSKLL